MVISLWKAIQFLFFVATLRLGYAASYQYHYADWFSEFGENEPVDCSLTPWEEWEECKRDITVRHAPYRKYRMRSKTEASNGGVPCPPGIELMEHEACTQDEALVDLFLEQLHSTNRFYTKDFETADLVECPYCDDDTTLPPSKGGGRLNLSSFISSNTECAGWEDSAGSLIAGGGECNSTRSRRSIRRRSTVEHLVKRNKDIVFLLDESGSVGPANFEIVKRIAAALIKSFCGNVKVKHSLTRVAVASFDDLLHVHYQFNNEFWNNGIELAKAVKSIKYNSTSSGKTCIESALTSVHQDLFINGHGSRLNSSYADDVIVMITDGCRNCGQDPLSAAREQLERDKIALLTLYMGDDAHCVESLNQDLSHDAKCFNFFARKSWEKAKKFMRDLEKKECFFKQFRGKWAESCY